LIGKAPEQSSQH